MSAVQFPTGKSSEEAIRFVKSLLKTPNDEILETEVIAKYTSYMWRQFRPDRIWSMFVNFAWLLLLCFHAFDALDQKFIIALLFVFNFVFAVIEIVEIAYLGFYGYFSVQYYYTKLSDCWRYIIWFRIIFSFLYLAFKLDGDTEATYLSMAVLFSVIRMIAFLINSDRSRPYVRMLWVIVIQTIPFLSMFMVFIFAVTISYAVLKEVEFSSAWI